MNYNKKTTIMLQVRTGSYRLPAKVLAKIEGKPMTWHIINRLKRVKLADQIILITTNKPEDKILLNLAKKNNILGFAGPINDVLKRHYLCALKYDCDPIIRISGDCPLTDPLLIDKIISFYQQNKYDYVYFDGDHTYEGAVRDLKFFGQDWGGEGFICWHDIHYTKMSDAARVEYNKFWQKYSPRHPSRFELSNHYSGLGFIQKV